MGKLHLTFYFVTSFLGHGLCPHYAFYYHTGQPKKRLGIKKQNYGNHGGDHQGHHAKRRGLLHRIFEHRLFRPAEECLVNYWYKVSRIQQRTSEQDKQNGHLVGLERPQDKIPLAQKTAARGQPDNAQRGDKKGRHGHWHPSADSNHLTDVLLARGYEYRSRAKE